MAKRKNCVMFTNEKCEIYADSAIRHLPMESSSIIGKEPISSFRHSIRNCFRQEVEFLATNMPGISMVKSS